MRKFEIPFNEDLLLINELRNFPPESIHCIYMPPPLELYPSVPRSKEHTDKLSQITIDDFKYQVDHIQKYFPNKVQLLLQMPHIVLEGADLDIYYNLGIKKYCTGTARQAKMIKLYYNNFNEDVETTCSVIGDVDEDILNYSCDNYSYFNNIVLPFRFCNDLDRTINIINKFPQFNFILFCNSDCHRFCRNREHWITPMGGGCPKDRDKNSALIQLDDMKIYDKYISIYKLVDRGRKTKDIIKDFKKYLNA